MNWTAYNCGMEQNPHPLDYATPEKSKRSAAYIAVAVSLAIAMGVAMFALVEVAPTAPAIAPPRLLPATNAAPAGPSSPANQ